MDSCKVFCSMKRGAIGCTSAVKEDLNVFFEIFSPTGLNWILLRIIGLTELVLDEKLTMNLVKLFTAFFLGTITIQGRWSAMVPDEIVVSVGKLPFTAKTIDNLSGWTLDHRKPVHQCNFVPTSGN